MTTAIRPTFFSAQLKSGLRVPGPLAPQFGLEIGAMPDDGFSTGPESLEQRALAMARDLVSLPINSFM